MSRLVRGIALGRFILPTVGDTPKCLLYAGTLADAIAQEVAAESPEPWRARGIADLRTYTLREIVGAIESALGRTVPRIPLSAAMISRVSVLRNLRDARSLRERSSSSPRRLRLHSRRSGAARTISFGIAVGRT